MRASSSGDPVAVATTDASPVRAALGLAFATAVSLGLARFAYALLLPAMRADLGWSYLTAGAMNTVNAAGYLVGAIATGRWLARRPARGLLVAANVGTAAALVAHGLVVDDASLYVFRFLSGVGSAGTLIAGALLATRLVAAPVTTPSTPARRMPSAGLVVGIYYGGTGLGIVAATAVVPWLSALPIAHAWRLAWVGLGVLALVATVPILAGARGIDAAPAPATARVRFDVRPFLPALAAYFLFGLGYIGYMTFVITLLREWHLSSGVVVAFYAVLGGAVCASPWIWGGLLQRSRSGLPLALLSGLLAVATALPVASARPVVAFASGLLFGAVFLSLVASTTALVRHNAAPGAWSSGIAWFTTAFAAGQIVGPTLVGWVADASGGLRGGLASSAVVLAAASAIASLQKAQPPR